MQWSQTKIDSDEAWPRQSSIQMDPNFHLSTCIEDKIVPSKVITSVVPATTPPMPKSKQKEKYFLKEIE